MSAIQRYLANLAKILDDVEKTQTDALEKGARLLADASTGGHNIFSFGCGHASLLALELYYRTGGMVNINPVRAPGLNLDIDPATMTSQMERLNGYGKAIVDALPMKPGDVIIIHSVSGRNPVPIDVALAAKDKGATVIALTNLTTATAVKSRHPSGKMLHDAADLVLDNCGCMGDASTDVQGVPSRVGPTSTAVGAAMLNAMITRAVELVAEQGDTPPVFVSANVEGGDEHNARLLEKYKDHIFYM